MDKTIILKVYYLGQCGCGFSREVTRKIELKEDASLDDLQDAIICQDFGWDDPHLYSFHLDNIPYSRNRSKEYTCDPNAEMLGGKMPNSTETKLKDLKLKKNQKFLFVFDFGDDHYFGINVEGFGEPKKDKEYPNITEKKRKAPKQYT